MSTRMHLTVASIVAAVLLPWGISAQSLQSTPPPGFPGKVKPGTVEVAPISRLSTDPAVRGEMLKLRDMQTSQGWMAAPESRAAVVDGYFDDERVRGRLKPSLVEVEGHLRMAPSQLRGTLLESADLAGAVAAGGFVNGGWTGLARAFNVPELGRVVLEEYDYVAAGSYILVPQELVDSTINGLPVQYSVRKTRSGKAWTELRWFTASKEFRLYVGKPIAKSDRLYVDLMDLAQKLN